MIYHLCDETMAVLLKEDQMTGERFARRRYSMIWMNALIIIITAGPIDVNTIDLKTGMDEALNWANKDYVI